MHDPVELSRLGIEVWAGIHGHPGYQASNMGRIRSLDREIVYICRGKEQRAKFKSRVLKPVRHSHSGHVNVTVGAAPKVVHQLVLETFVGPRPIGLITRHLDGNAKNNALFNIKYGTISENRHDDVRNGLYDRGRGAKARNVKLSENDVIMIRAKLKEPWHGKQISDLAQQYGVSNATIEAIKYRRNWKHLED